jgi:hypothetical protein
MTASQKRKVTDTGSDDLRLDPDPFIALRRWGGWRGWGAWLAAHTLAFIWEIGGLVVLAFIGSQIERVPLIGAEKSEERKAAADFLPVGLHLLPFAVGAILIAHVALVLLLRICRPHIIPFARAAYMQAERKKWWQAERARRIRGRMTFRQRQEQLRRQNKYLLAAFILAAIVGTGLVWLWWEWPWEASLATGRRAEIVGFGILAGSALGVAGVLVMFTAGVTIVALGWLLLVPERWIGHWYVSRLIEDRSHRGSKQKTGVTTVPSRAEARSDQESAQVREPAASSLTDSITPGSPPSLGLLTWLSAGDWAKRGGLLSRSAPIPCSSRRVSLNQLAAYVIAADIHELEQWGHFRISIERRRWHGSLVRPHRLVRHGRGLRIQQQLYDSPIIDLDARIDDDLTGLVGDLSDMRDQLRIWMDEECEDPQWAIMKQVIYEARQLGLVVASSVPPNSGSNQSKHHDRYEWAGPKVADLVRNSSTESNLWLEFLANHSGKADVTRRSLRIYRRDMRKIRKWPELPERLLGVITMLIISFIKRRRREWPHNASPQRGQTTQDGYKAGR